MSKQDLKYFLGIFERLRTQRKKAEVRRKVNDEMINTPYNGSADDSIINYMVNVNQTLAAHIWSRCLQTPDTWGIAKGTDEVSKEKEEAYNEVLKQVLKRMQFPVVMNESISKYGLPYGYFVYRLYWNDQAAIDSRNKYLSGVNGIKSLKDASIAVKTDIVQSMYDGITLENIHPKQFYKDTSVKDEKYQIKCLVEYRTYFELKDLGYDVPEKFLREANSQVNELSLVSDRGYREDRVDEYEYPIGKAFKIMTFYGNFLINGKEYRDHKVVILNDKEIIYFEPQSVNDEILIHGELYPAQDGYGLTPIFFIQNLQKYQNKLYNTLLKCTEHQAQPALFTQKGSMPTNIPMIAPGTMIEIDNPSPEMPWQPPMPYQVSASPMFPVLQLIEQQVEALTGATRQLSGNVTNNDKSQTATEFKGLQIVGSIVLTRLVDQFNQTIKGMIVKKIMELYAKNIPSQIRVYTKDKTGKDQETIIDKEIFQLVYDYDFTDPKDETERKQYLQEKTQFLVSMLQVIGQVNPQDLQRIDFFSFIRSVLLDYGEKEVKFLSDDEIMEKVLEASQLADKIQQAMQPPAPPPPTADDLLQQTIAQTGLDPETAAALNSISPAIQQQLQQSQGAQ